MSNMPTLSCIMVHTPYNTKRIHSSDGEELYADCDLDVASTEQLKAFFLEEKVK